MRRLGAGDATGRWVVAEEGADVVAFLCPPRSRAVRGDTIASGGAVSGRIHC